MKSVNKTYFNIILILFLLEFFYYVLFDSLIPCYFHKLMGLYCPGCGVSRMLISIFKLDFYQAFRYNPFLFVMLILSLLYLIVKLITCKLSTKELKLNNYVFVLVLVLTIVFGVLRNLPYFSYLIPTVVK